MEKIYSEQSNACRLTRVKEETISFLLQYSRSLKVLNYQGFQFESHLN